MFEQRFEEDLPVTRQRQLHGIDLGNEVIVVIDDRQAGLEKFDIDAYLEQYIPL